MITFWMLQIQLKAKILIENIRLEIHAPWPLATNQGEYSIPSVGAYFLHGHCNQKQNVCLCTIINNKKGIDTALEWGIEHLSTRNHNNKKWIDLYGKKWIDLYG